MSNKYVVKFDSKDETLLKIFSVEKDKLTLIKTLKYPIKSALTKSNCSFSPGGKQIFFFSAQELNILDIK